MILDLRHAGLASHAARTRGMEVERAFGLAAPRAAVGDQREAQRGLPVAIAGIDLRDRSTANERELRALQHDAAIGRGEAAGGGAGDNHPANGELAFETFALRFKIDGAGKACEIVRDRVVLPQRVVGRDVDVVSAVEPGGVVGIEERQRVGVVDRRQERVGIDEQGPTASG